MQLEEFDIEFLAQKMSENPRSMLFARLADLYLVKEQNAEAMTLLEEGIPNFPGYYAAYIVLGKAHLAFKEYSRASAAFSKALELSPFNQNAAQLLTTVPNKPDESTRTTDENYFAPPVAAASNVPPETPHPISLEPEPEPAAVVPSYEAPVQDTFDMQSLEDPEIPQQQVFDPYAAAIEAAAAASASAAASAAHTSYAEPEQQQYQQPDESFPTYDEYFAQNQQRINVDAPIRLDDYLSGDAPAIAAEAPVIEEMPQHEFVNESYVEPEDTPFTPFSPKAAEFSTESTEPEPHFDPEPVFSSPEQAQLFAEMTGMDEPSSSSSTDLDSLTQKLQSAEKIVPEENYQPKTPMPQDTSEDKAYETDAVTPTLAEIYASQGEYRAAIQAYEILMFSQPAKGGEFQQRIRELQQLQMEKDGLI
jgi:tetratricopeptide (TPR) repeat protein